MWNLAYGPGLIVLQSRTGFLKYSSPLISSMRRDGFLLLDRRRHLSCWFAADKLLRDDEAAGFVADFR